MLVALLLPLAVLALACALERFESRVCGEAPRPRRRSRAAPDQSVAPALCAVTTHRDLAGDVATLDGPTLRLVRDRPTRVVPSTSPALRQAS